MQRFDANPNAKPDDPAAWRWYADDQAFYDQGWRYISTTKVLSYAMPFGLQVWLRSNMPDIIASKSTIALTKGSDIHATIEAAEQHRATTTAHPEAIVQWQTIKSQHQIVTVSNAQELLVAHPAYGYAGTLDQVTMFEGKKVVLDLKTGKYYDIKTAWQLAAYKYAYEAMTGETGLGMIGVHLPGNKPPTIYRYQHYESCFLAFLSVLNAFRMHYFNKLKKINWPWLLAPMVSIGPGLQAHTEVSHAAR